MKHPEWLRLRSTARGDWAFIRRWTVVLGPAWGLVTLAAWALPDSTYLATKPWIDLGIAIAIIFACVLPDDYTRLRRAGSIYLLSALIYRLMRRWVVGQ